METGRTVILLNLENLYESLYDVLNQVCVCVLRILGEGRMKKGLLSWLLHEKERFSEFQLSNFTFALKMTRASS